MDFPEISRKRQRCDWSENDKEKFIKCVKMEQYNKERISWISFVKKYKFKQSPEQCKVFLIIFFHVESLQ